MKILINPPPSDAKCECCGRHISKLKPFGKAGDPLVGDFDGCLLIKTFRAMGSSKEVEKRWGDSERFYIPPKTDRNPTEFVIFDEEAFIKEFDEEQLKEFYWADQLANSISASWECRDCIVLDTEEYLKKVYDRWIKQSKETKENK